MTDPRRGTAASITVTVRPQVAAFALAMEAKLQARDEKYGWWGGTSFFALLQRLKTEFWELHEAIVFGNAEQIADEARDVANMALFIFDNATRGNSQCQENASTETSKPSSLQ